MTDIRRSTRAGLRRPLSLALAILMALGAVIALGGPAAQAADSYRINLRVLVVSAGDPATEAITVELQRQGVPFTKVSMGAAGRPQIDAAFLTDNAGTTGRFQAVVLPNQAGGGLAAAELQALASYESAFGVRQVNGYDFPTTSMGAVMQPNGAGWLDGAAATVTPAGLAGPFSYLRGPLTIEDADGQPNETYGYVAGPDPALPAGQSFTPLVTTSVGGSTGGILSVYAHDGREELVVTASFNQYMQWYNILAEGIVSWATRGVMLGYNRNYLNVHIDDVFLPDSRWSASGNCTPGDGCVDPSVTTPDIRMVPADVDRAVAWQNARGIKLDMVFNGGGAEAARAANGGNDPLTTKLLASKAQFPWINHTYTHPYLGCIQVAPQVQGDDWRCKTSSTQTGQDPEITAAISGGTYWASQAYIAAQVNQNISWANTNGLRGLFNPAELVTGEHSGLASLPQMPADNPFLAPALSGAGVRYTGSDASREKDPRSLAGGRTVTVPRYPMNIFYNAGTYLDEVDEYNWIYTSAANGGSGLCENNASSTCISPLPSATPAQAQQSFLGYITPLEVRNALRFVLTNDPRPFYAHQSNLAEDGILYPVLDGIIATYNAAVDTSVSPLVQATLTGQHQALTRISDWRAAGAADGWIDTAGVHLPASAAAVPLTVPTGTTGITGLSSYGKALSGWVSGGSNGVLPVIAGGYNLVTAPAPPAAPSAASAVPGVTSATVSWTAPANSVQYPTTGYSVRIYRGSATTPERTVTRDAAATTLTVTGLTNGISYRFAVAATNSVGTGPNSALTAAVTPLATLAPAPSAATAQAGNESAKVTWTAPADTTGITQYRVQALGLLNLVARTVTVPAGQTVAAVSGLNNGTSYTFVVTSMVGTTAAKSSPRTSSITPQRTSQTDVAPALTSAVAGNRSVTANWSPPAVPAGQVITGYRISAIYNGTTLTARSTTVPATARTGSVTSLLNGIDYQVEVNVVTASGQGPASARSAVLRPR